MRRERLMNHRWRMGVAALAVVTLQWSHAWAEEAPKATTMVLRDVPAALSGVGRRQRELTILRGDKELPRGGHIQGVAWLDDPGQRRGFALISHDSETVGYLAIAEFAAEDSTGRIVNVLRFPSDGQLPPLRHAGGIQLLGEVLVVGVEDNQDKKRAEVQFWNLAKPTEPAQFTHLTIKRSGPPKFQTAGAVGIARHGEGYLAAVANWDSRDVDFYLSNGRPLADPAARFRWDSRWSATGADMSNWKTDRRFGAYQSLQLLRDSTDALFVFGFETLAGDRDAVDLFTLEFATKGPQLRKTDTLPLNLPSGVHFRYGAGSQVTGGTLRILGTPRALGETMRISVSE